MDIIKRLDEMIIKGDEVLRTHVPNPPNLIGSPTLNEAMFGAWKTQTIAFLESFLPQENAYLKEFRKSIDSAHSGTASTGSTHLNSQQIEQELVV
ncbi:MAG TPA: hypothetical protein PKW49_13325, partial [Paludibacteraceae bacterium]|nr:hypothetical protein [Paludibacteraceae bacterium]HQF51221.1 hypothetical protein [Paludibacteraceae bacterium]